MFNRNWRRRASLSRRSWYRISTLGFHRRWLRHCSRFHDGGWCKPHFLTSCIAPLRFSRTESKTCKRLERQRRSFCTLCTGFCFLQLKNVLTAKMAKRSWWIHTITFSQFRPSRWVMKMLFKNIFDSNSPAAVRVLIRSSGASLKGVWFPKFPSWERNKAVAGNVGVSFTKRSMFPVAS